MKLNHSIDGGIRQGEPPYRPVAEGAANSAKRPWLHSIPKPVAVEARAKIFWGASTATVREYLQSKNVEEEDALALIEEVLRERAQVVRAEGVAKTWTGALLVLVPIGYFLIAQMLGFLMLKLFAGLIVLGLFGLLRLTKGLSMMLSPRSVSGDLSNADEV